LSGGGARGLAHVGVLKVLEELRVPIHCVTGTSMGAIVGGTFAAGRAPEEMERIVLAADWDTIFRDKPPRKEISVRRKADDYKTLFAPEFGVKDDGLALPKGVIAGVPIESFFRVLATSAFGVTDFKRLRFAFRGMGTDIESGEAVVLDRGSVAQAMRASMSVPGAIAPVEIDGRLLVDGGIANNLPINQARELCADVVIAVNISTPPLKRGDITSALSVAAQLVNFLGKQTVDAQLKSLGPKDVLIAPDLGDISAATFDRSEEAIRIGEQATRALAESLSSAARPALGGHGVVRIGPSWRGHLRRTGVPGFRLRCGRQLEHVHAARRPLRPDRPRRPVSWRQFGLRCLSDDGSIPQAGDAKRTIC
jgi:NTE family protein